MNSDIRDIEFEVTRDIYWDNWGRFILVFF
jgi:hypothetical protein